jgi:hypothetical protein
MFTSLHLILINMLLAQETGKVNFEGVTFTVPSNWKGVKQNDLYLMVSETEAGIILVTPAYFSSLDLLREELNRQQSDGSSVTLSRVKPIEKIGSNALGAEFAGNFNFETATMYVAGTITANKRGFLIYAGTSTEMYSNHYKELSIRIIESLRTTAVSAPAQRSVQTGNEWERFYANTRLTYIDSYYSSGYGGDISGGYSNKIVIDLCGQGYFNYRNDFELSGGSESSSFGSSDGQSGSGTWSISPKNESTATLILNFQNGKRIEYTMLYNENGATFLNGDRFYKTTANDQVTDHRPQCY